MSTKLYQLRVGITQSESVSLAYHEVKERQVDGLIVTARRCHQSERWKSLDLGLRTLAVRISVAAEWWRGSHSDATRSLDQLRQGFDMCHLSL